MRQTLILIVALAGCAISAFAQTSSRVPEVERSRLGSFAGRWHFEEDLAGGKDTKTTTCEFFPGGYHLVCESDGTSPGGPIKGQSIMGYDAAGNTFTFHTISSNGIAMFVRGTVNGQTWVGNTEFTFNGQLIKARLTWTEQSPTSQSFKLEGSIGGGPWMILEEATGTKVQ